MARKSDETAILKERINQAIEIIEEYSESLDGEFKEILIKILKGE